VHLLLADVGPNFVALNATAVEIAHLVIGEHGAAGPDLDHKTHDRIAVCIRHPLSGPDRGALYQAIDHLGPARKGKAVHLSSQWVRQ
jgi:hypothetical protein